MLRRFVRGHFKYDVFDFIAAVRLETECIGGRVDKMTIEMDLVALLH